MKNTYLTKIEKLLYLKKENKQSRNVQILFRIPNINDPYCTDAFLVFFCQKSS